MTKVDLKKIFKQLLAKTVYFFPPTLQFMLVNDKKKRRNLSIVKRKFKWRVYFFLAFAFVFSSGSKSILSSLLFLVFSFYNFFSSKQQNFLSQIAFVFYIFFVTMENHRNCINNIFLTFCTGNIKAKNLQKKFICHIFFYYLLLALFFCFFSECLTGQWFTLINDNASVFRLH